MKYPSYKLAITASGMTYQLVPPDDHRRNIAEKLSKPGRITSLPSSVAQALNFPSTFGANYYHKWSANSVSRQSNAYPTFPPIRISMAIMTTSAHPFVPGMEALVRQTPPRKSFAQHCTKGYVIGTSTSTTAAGKYGHQPAHHPCHSFLQTQPLQTYLIYSQTISRPITTTKSTNQISPDYKQTTPSNAQQHSPAPTHPSSPAAVSDYDNDSSDSDIESITIPHRCPAASATSRVSPQQTKTPLPRVSAPQPPGATRSGIALITQETILHLLHNTRTPLTPQNAATRQSPCDALSAILDTDTGELLEYRHLIKNPKYCTIWKNAYGKELGKVSPALSKAPP
eukprot:CCRYP_001786-RA/>CCRYP_001786-RA protein AED:0.36 eAED:0.36 QI:0/0/0/1/0/0/2/0/340